jgi:hypothetical protein
MTSVTAVTPPEVGLCTESAAGFKVEGDAKTRSALAA